MGKLYTASGAVYDSDYFVVMPNQPYLFLRVLNISLETARMIFSDQSEISCLRYANITAFGYNTLESIFMEGDAVKVVLMK